MKNFTYLLLAGLFTFILQDSLAQSGRFLNLSAKKPVTTTQTSARQTPNRCFTMEGLDIYFRNNPEAKALAESNKNRFAPETVTSSGQNHRTQAIVNVPVVFHIVGNATRQTQVTDADILWQLNKLNEDYAGANADSTNGVGFYPIRAKKDYSQIRFCMAQRTPADLPTNGIVRVVSTLTGTQNCNDVDAQGNATLIKHTSSGGSDAWDPSKYMNIWVGEYGPCLLGIATFPGTGNPNEQGVVISYEGFSNNPVYVDPAFALGRTLAHEAGHYWGLLHLWGDDAGCTNSDFRQLPGSCILPASLAGTVTDQGVGDTPNQGNATLDCPTGTRTDGCATVAPGINYQNYMDYTMDACYSMFTMKQVDRMQWVLDNCRASLKTSNGCTAPPPAGGNDARISVILSPAPAAVLGCASVTPVVTIQNLGTATLTSASIVVRVNDVAQGAPYPYAWTGSLIQGATANVTLPAFNIAGTGAFTIKIHTTLPNGLVDANATNDTSTVNITRIAPSALPVTNGFETALTPPGWTVSNPNGDALAWFRFNPTGGSAGGSTWAAVMDNYSFDLKGTVDDIISPVVSTTGLLANDSILVSFDLAHKNFPDPGFEDSLKILVSNNCGVTWTTIWSRGDPQLATASDVNLYNPPAAGDWRTYRPAVGNNIFGAGQIQVAVRNVNGFGNTMWLDNINIMMKPRKDMQTTALIRPNITECAPPFAPSLTVRNNGGELVSAFKTGYILNNGTPVIQSHNIPLATGQTATVTFPNLNPPAGINTIKMFVTDAITPSVGPDGTPGNDTLTRTFSVPTTVANVVQGFEGTTFIPTNWSLLNANNNVTWIRKTPGKGSDFSAFIDNYNNNTIGQLDIMQAPPINTVDADSVIITFDVSHKDYPGSLDRLRVLVSTNCGVSYTAVYAKAGSGGANGLATAPSSDADFTTPAQNEWRNETIRLNNTFTGGNLIVQFENRNDFGNNIFIDNINIAPKYKRDLEVRTISPDLVCTPNITPVVTVLNRGTETVTAFTIAYTIGGGTPVTQNVTGINLASNASMNVTLAAGALAGGANNIKAYTSAPVTVSGTGDQYLLNDTASKVSYAAGSVQVPTNTTVVETFEGSFIPSGWALTNPDNSLTWQKAGVGKSSAGSAYMRNFAYYSAGQRDALITPVVNFTGVDSVKAWFDLSAATRNYPGSTTIGLDTLEVLVTKDCGATFTSVYKKWGTALQTVNDPNNPQLAEYTPGINQFLWRTEYIDLSSFAPTGPLQLVFRNSNNNQNNVYIDNVNFKTVTLPPRLRADGVIAVPNPFNERFNLWFIQAPSDLRFIRVLNAAGQMIWSKSYSSGSPTNLIDVNLTGKAAGVYIIHVGYSNEKDDKHIRVIKTN